MWGCSLQNATSSAATLVAAIWATHMDGQVQRLLWTPGWRTPGKRNGAPTPYTRASHGLHPTHLPTTCPPRPPACNGAWLYPSSHTRMKWTDMNTHMYIMREEILHSSLERLACSLVVGLIMVAVCGLYGSDVHTVKGGQAGGGGGGCRRSAGDDASVRPARSCVAGWEMMPADGVAVRNGSLHVLLELACVVGEHLGSLLVERVIGVGILHMHHSGAVGCWWAAAAPSPITGSGG